MSYKKNGETTSSTPVKTWINKYKKAFIDYNKYVKSEEYNGDSIKFVETYNTQVTIVKIVLNRLKYFINSFEAFRELKYVEEFINLMTESIYTFKESSKLYIETNEWLAIEDSDEQQAQINFQADMMSDLNLIDDTIAKLNIDSGEHKFEELPIHSDKKIPLLMAGMLEEKYSAIEKYSKAVRSELGLGNINLNVMSVIDNTEMYINMKNPPAYDNSKHYFEQTEDVLQFYAEEKYKLLNGINIAGVHINGWLYWHINYFKTDIPAVMLKGTPRYIEGRTRIVTQPLLRDNEVFVTDMYYEAKKQNKGMFMFGSRRIGKTVLEASLLTYLTAIIQMGENYVYGGNSSDLLKLSKTLEIGFQNINPAFYLPRNQSDWENHIEFGLRHKDNTKIPYGDIYITNLNESRRKTEKGASGTPTGFIVDEGGKFDIRTLWNTSLPSFNNPEGWGVTPLLAGCFVKGTKVYDIYGNYINVEDLTFDTGTLGFDVSLNNLSVEPISHINPPSEKECLTITTESGEVVTCSTDHPFYIDGEFVEADSIGVGMKLESPYIINSELSIANKSDRLANTVGFYVGTSTELNSEEVENLISITGSNYNTRLYFAKGIIYSCILREIKDCIEIEGNRETLLIVKAIFHSLGIHGSISDKQLTFDLYNLVKTLSIIETTSLNNKADLYYGELKNSPKYKEMVVRFNKELTSKKTIQDKVISIERVGMKEVYNITTSFTHTYLANGFITHNTGGNKKLSVGAREMLLNPDTYSLISMDWDRLENYVKEENLVTWKRKSFGVFLPAQMSFKEGLKKEISNLSDFLNVPDDKLKEIEIRVTNWKKSKEIIEADYKNAAQLPQMLKKERMYYPLNTDDCFLTDGTSVYEEELLLRHITDIEFSGETGGLFMLKRANNARGVMKTKAPPHSTEPEFPHTGGVADAPFWILEDPYEDITGKTPDYLYVAGLDAYKTDLSTGNSIGVLIVYKRYIGIETTNANTVVAMYAARPNNIETFNERCELLLQYYNATLLMENQDTSLIRHLRANNTLNKYVLNGEKVSRAIINPEAKQRNKLGLNPNAENQGYMFDKIVEYVNETLSHNVNELGEEEKVIGGTRIKNVMILKELVSNVKNVDRLIAFGHALILAEYYDATNKFPRAVTAIKNKYKQKVRRTRNILGVSSRKLKGL